MRAIASRLVGNDVSGWLWFIIALRIHANAIVAVILTFMHASPYVLYVVRTPNTRPLAVIKW